MSHAVSREAAQETPAHVAVLQMITARWVSQAISAAAQLGIADQLKSGTRSVAELAAATNSDPASLYRLMRALASVGIFAEAEGSTGEAGARRFSMTPLAEPLRADVPNSMRGAALMFGSDWSVRAWAGLKGCVQTGEAAFNRVFGEPLFEYLPKNPESLNVFHRAMKSFTALTQDAIIASCDFSGVSTVVDVGGGSGYLLSGILAANPRLRGILYDRADAIATAAPVLDAAGVASRCTLVAGDFFKGVPRGAEICILKHIIHDWDDEHAGCILHNCREALPADGRVLVVEFVIGSGNDPSLGKLLDLEMIVMAPGGRERTEEEYRKLFSAAGLRLARIIPTMSPVSILEGCQPS